MKLTSGGKLLLGSDGKVKLCTCCDCTACAVPGWTAINYSTSGITAPTAVYDVGPNVFDGTSDNVFAKLVGLPGPSNFTDATGKDFGSLDFTYCCTQDGGGAYWYQNYVQYYYDSAGDDEREEEATEINSLLWIKDGKLWVMIGTFGEPDFLSSGASGVNASKGTILFLGNTPFGSCCDTYTLTNQYASGDVGTTVASPIPDSVAPCAGGAYLASAGFQLVVAAHSGTATVEFVCPDMGGAANVGAAAVRPRKDCVACSRAKGNGDQHG